MDEDVTLAKIQRGSYSHPTVSFHFFVPSEFFENKENVWKQTKKSQAFRKTTSEEPEDVSSPSISSSLRGYNQILLYIQRSIVST